MMGFNDRLYVEIVPLENGHSPHPHPIRDGKFNTDFVYKVLGVYNPSETSECYFMLANTAREIWFISQRHTRAFGLFESNEMFLRKESVACRAAPFESLGRNAGRMGVVKTT